MKPVTKHVVLTTFVLLAGAVAAFAIFVWSGVYNIAADDPHTAPVHTLLATLRERSMETRAEKIKVPDLSDHAQIVKGAGNYAAMCAGCHLAPGVDESEISKGLYPTPPNLTKEKVEPEHAFWAIKHGIKASGMPAWGKSMDEASMWSLTAFLQALPKLDATQYDEMVDSSGGHSHGDGGSEPGAHPHVEGAGQEPHHDSVTADHHDAAETSDHHGDEHAEVHGPASHDAASGANAEAKKKTARSHTHADGKQHEHSAK